MYIAGISIAVVQVARNSVADKFTEDSLSESNINKNAKQDKQAKTTYGQNLQLRSGSFQEAKATKP